MMRSKTGSSVFMALLLLSGCSALMTASRVPEVRQLTVSDTPDVAYGKAVRATLALGSELVQHDPHTRTLSARLHNAVVLNIAVEPEGPGARVIATGSLLPNKMVLGSFTEVDDFVAAYGKER